MRIKNRFGTERIGSRQRNLLERMIENGGVWNPDWYVYAEDLNAFRGLIGKGIIASHNQTWCVTEKFKDERLP